MRSKLLTAVIGVAFILSQSPLSLAATKIVSISVAKSVPFAKLVSGSGDQIYGAVLAGKTVVLTGTLEDQPSSWIASPGLGGSDGVITAIDLTGKQLWDLRLGGATDDIATALVRDSSGSFWVVGASVLPIATPSPTPSTTPSPSATPTDSVTPSPSSSPSPSPSVLNPDQVQIDPIDPTSQSLSRLTVWKVSKTGQLLATYFTDLSATLFPKSISFDGKTFQIAGQLAQSAVKNFSLTLSPEGVFSTVQLSKYIPAANAPLQVAAGTAMWRIFQAKSPIPGISKWVPKVPTWVAIRYSKSGNPLTARILDNGARFALWQSSIGLVVISDLAKQGGFGLTIVSPLEG